MILLLYEDFIIYDERYNTIQAEDIIVVVYFYAECIRKSVWSLDSWYSQKSKSYSSGNTLRSKQFSSPNNVSYFKIMYWILHKFSSWRTTIGIFINKLAELLQLRLHNLHSVEITYSHSVICYLKCNVHIYVIAYPFAASPALHIGQRNIKIDANRIYSYMACSDQIIKVLVHFYSFIIFIFIGLLSIIRIFDVNFRNSWIT